MTDSTYKAVNAKVRKIIDDAIDALHSLGMDSRSNAAALMAIQSIIRIDDNNLRDTVADFADSCRETGEGAVLN